MHEDPTLAKAPGHRSRHTAPLPDRCQLNVGDLLMWEVTQGFARRAQRVGTVNEASRLEVVQRDRLRHRQWAARDASQAGTVRRTAKLSPEIPRQRSDVCAATAPDLGIKLQ